MTPTAMFIAALVLLPLAIALVIWARFVITQVGDLGSPSEFEEMDFEIGAPTAEHSEGARWPTPG